MHYNSVSQPFSSATQIRIRTLSARTAAILLDNYKTKTTDHKNQNFCYITFIAISLQKVFEMVAQHHSTLNVLNALRPDVFCIGVS